MTHPWVRDTLTETRTTEPGTSTTEDLCPCSAGDAWEGTPLPDALASVRTADAGLVGRSAECAALASFLDRALGTGAVLLVTGEPGVGKTVLLESVVRDAVAADATVLQAAGVEFEAEVGFAGLNQLLLPLLGDLETLPEPHREALVVALGLGAGPSPHRLLVSAAVLCLLTRAAESRPVLEQAA